MSEVFDVFFTREQILAAIALRPCHVTGMHTPDHHIDHRSPFDGTAVAGYVCQIMRAEAFGRLLDLIFVKEEDLPHELHPACGWCYSVPTQEKDRAQLRRTYEWADVPIPPDLMKEGSAT